MISLEGARQPVYPHLDKGFRHPVHREWAQNLIPFYFPRGSSQAPEPDMVNQVIGTNQITVNTLGALRESLRPSGLVNGYNHIALEPVVDSLIAFNEEIDG